jgi:chromosome segregation ATPase
MLASTTADARWSDAAEVEAAIASVLEAERAAGAAVETCAAQAQARVQQARDRARAIAERAAQRTAHVRRVSAARLEARLAAVERERQALGRHTDTGAGDLQRLQAAINRLADVLAGGAHDFPRGAP